MDMISNRPYLLRAFYQWIVDSGCTPILVIDAFHPRCHIPQDFAEDGEIVFNISSAAVRDLRITNQIIEFNASFSGIVHHISAPVNAILSIHADENGEGIFFDSDDAPEDPERAPSRFTSIEGASEEVLRQRASDASNPSDKPKPFLKLVDK